MFSLFFLDNQNEEEMSYLFMSVRMKDEVRIFIDENNNVEKHYYYDQSLERWAKQHEGGMT